ncbi:MAG: hypothetical protein J6C81_06440 [Muribaculaceae bacterium]|nr:hypothetical protein [Muribaculaceae bacterium]
MEATEYIEYHKANYPLYSIEFNDDLGEHNELVSIQSLSDALFDNDGKYVDHEAEEIDDSIFYYIPDELSGQSIEEIREFIENDIA